MLQEQSSMNSDWGSVGGGGRIGMPLLMPLFSPEVVCIHCSMAKASGTNIKHGRRRVYRSYEECDLEIFRILEIGDVHEHISLYKQLLSGWCLFSTTELG